MAALVPLQLWRHRHLDLGGWRLQITAGLRRLDCPDHGVRVEAVPFARPGAGFTRDFEDLVAWLAHAGATAAALARVEMDQDAVRQLERARARAAQVVPVLVRIDWRTVGRICQRVVADELDPDRLEGLFNIGVDEISWKKFHNYLTLVVNHDTGTVVWGAEGKDATTLDSFFEELGETRSGQIRGISVDMAKAWPGPIAKHASQAKVCYDPFHIVSLATKALDVVRRVIWQQLRRIPDQDAAATFKGARWPLLKKPEDLTDDQAASLAAIRSTGGAMRRAYRLKEALRAVFNGDLDTDQTDHLLGRWISWAQRCRWRHRCSGTGAGCNPSSKPSAPSAPTGRGPSTRSASGSTTAVSRA